MREHSPWSYYSKEPNETDVPANHRGKAEVGVCAPHLPRWEKFSTENVIEVKADDPSHTDVTKALVQLIQYIWTSVQKMHKTEEKQAQHVT